MLNFLIFGLSVAMSLAAWGYLCACYVWPRIRAIDPGEAVRLLLCLHLFRFVGMSFLVSGVAGANLGLDFTVPGAVGDLVATILAWITIAVRSRPGGVIALWIFNIWGSADLLYAFYKGRSEPTSTLGDLGATFYIPTLLVPLLMCTHVMIFMHLLRSKPGLVALKTGS